MRHRFSQSLTLIVHDGHDDLRDFRIFHLGHDELLNRDMQLHAGSAHV